MSDHRQFGRRMTDPDHPDPVLEMVTKATGNALDQRRRIMFRDSFVVAIIAALLIALPVTLIARHDAISLTKRTGAYNAAQARRYAAHDAAVARRNAAYNCGLLTSVAQIMGSGDPRDRALRHGGFVSTDAALRREQEINTTRIAALHPGPLKQLLADPETIRLTNASHALDVSTQRYWTSVLVPRLTALANANCATFTRRKPILRRGP